MNSKRTNDNFKRRMDKNKNKYILSILKSDPQKFYRQKFIGEGWEKE